MAKNIIYKGSKIIIPDDAYKCPHCGSWASVYLNISRITPPVWHKYFGEEVNLMTLSRDYNTPWNEEQKLPTFQCPRCRCIWQWEKDELKIVKNLKVPDDVLSEDKKPWYKRFLDGFTLKKGLINFK